MADPTRLSDYRQMSEALSKAQLAMSKTYEETRDYAMAIAAAIHSLRSQLKDASADPPKRVSRQPG